MSTTFFEETATAVNETAHQYSKAAIDCVEDHPFSSSIVSFALGIGVGVLAVTLLSGSSHVQQRNAAQRLGDQLLSSLRSVVPDRFI